MGEYDAFINVIVLVSFYSTAMLILANVLQPYSVNSRLLTQVNEPSTGAVNIAEDIQSTTQSQLNIPLIDLGALVFYSGNILIDWIVNFFTAIPSMVTLLLALFGMLFSIDSFIMAQIKLGAYSLVILLYFASLIKMAISIRSRGSVV